MIWWFFNYQHLPQNAQVRTFPLTKQTHIVGIISIALICSSLGPYIASKERSAPKIARNVIHPSKLTPKINFQNFEDEKQIARIQK